MTHGTFLWADLSSFRPDISRPFYTRVMGWSFDGYTAQTARGPVAGLYEMPEVFQRRNMPSFWMSYIAVDDIHQTVEIAHAHGGKVELGPEPFEGGGLYALIRDPLGAGFTVYQGDALAGSALGTGSRLGHGLFVSDASAVSAFYEALFGWQFARYEPGVQAIRLGGETLGYVHEISGPEIRGTEEYWAVYFTSRDLRETAKRVSDAGGEVLTQARLPEGYALLARDPDGAAFFAIGPRSRSRLSLATKIWLALFLGVLAYTLVFAG